MREREGYILKRLHEGEIVALISDAGTPGISDPGAELVQFAFIS
jgi:16S rRNA (cytidine1402-2'-O)-methyltransferase